MLKWLRKSSRSWFIGVAIGAIVVVFIFWGVGTLKSPAFQEAAEVNGTPILMATYQRQYQDLIKEYQERAKGELTEEMVKMMRLKEMALNRLIEETLLLQAGERLGLQVTDAELRAQIQSYPFFQKDGKFDQQRYFYVLSRSRLNPQNFEEQERRRLMLRKVVEDVTSLSKVSDAELQESYRLGHEAVSVQYLVVSPERYLAQQNPADAEVATYYQDHQGEFRVPARARVKYLTFRAKDFLDRVKLSPGEVETYLKDHSEEFTRPQVIRVRQLLLRGSPKGPPAEAQKLAKQAQDLLAQAREGEDFAELVKAHSQDAATKDKGGLLGDVRRGQQPPEWDQTAFSLKAGEVGQATTPQGIYLIKVEEVKETQRLPDAEAKVTSRLKAEKARRQAKETAEAARGALSGSPLAEVAKKYGVTPQETPLIGQRDQVPNLGVLPAFNQAALALKPQEISKVVDLPDGFAVLQGVEHQDEHLPPLDQVKDQVRQALKKQLAQKKAEQEAARWLAELRQGKTLAQVAAQAGVPIKDSDFFTRTEGFLKQRQAEALTSAAFQLSKENPYPAQPLIWQNNYYLLGFKARRESDPKEFAKERDQLAGQMLEQKRQQVFTSWLEGERQRAKIKIFELP